MRIIIPLVFLVGCGGSTVQAKGPCGTEERAAIGARYLAALEVACDHTKPLAECVAAPAITKKYETERAAWVLCSRK